MKSTTATEVGVCALGTTYYPAIFYRQGVLQVPSLPDAAFAIHLVGYLSAMAIRRAQCTFRVV
jgi:hypothetical protein